MVIPLDGIKMDARNPRTDAESTPLEELAESIRSGGMVQPPTVVSVDGGKRYRVLTGERRVRAARLAGLSEIVCLVREDPGAAAAHRMRVVENLHRVALNPIDEAAALRLCWLLANAEAMGLDVSPVLGERPPVDALPEVEKWLRERGFKPSTPVVTWDEVLDELGVAMKQERRKKLLRVLKLPQDVQQVLRQTPVTEAGLRAIGTLEEEQQRALAEAIEEEPELAPKVRRIARAMRDEGYSLEEALAEARGEYAESEEEKKQREESLEVGAAADGRLVDTVIALMDAASAIGEALERLRKREEELPEPWSNYYRVTIHNLLGLLMEVE